MLVTQRAMARLFVREKAGADFSLLTSPAPAPAPLFGEGVEPSSVLSSSGSKASGNRYYTWIIGRYTYLYE